MFNKMMWWFDDQDIGVKAKNQGLILFTNIYYVEYGYS
jgi:hypothetical protein